MSDDGAKPAPAILSVKELLERAKPKNRFLRLKANGTVTVRMMSVSVKADKNKFGRDDYQFQVLHEGVPKTLACPPRLAFALASLFKTDGLAVEGAEVRITRSVAGFETTYKAEALTQTGNVYAAATVGPEASV